MNEKYKLIYDLLSQKSIDWSAVELAVKSLGDSINDKYEEGTILSELYMDANTYKSGEILTRLTKLFLDNGYDVTANDEMNGAECLRNLCWSSYDKYVLHTAEMLLDAGANTRVNTDEDDEDGVMDSISWKFGYWNTGDYEAANMFVAYYEMVQAERAGEDYHGIRNVDDCIGCALTKVELMGRGEKGQEDYSFKDSLILWFGTMPLVVDRSVEFVVNPNKVRKEDNIVDISDSFSSILGKKLVGLKYKSASEAEMIFEDGAKFIFVNDSATAGNDNITANIIAVEG